MLMIKYSNVIKILFGGAMKKILNKINALQKKAKNIGDKAAQKVSAYVGTWLFVFIYTFSMALWIALHITGVLHIDTDSFFLWNLWLSYFAGTQASILLMSSNKQAYIDRRRDEEMLKTVKNNVSQLIEITEQIDIIEEVLEDMYQEVKEKKNEPESNSKE